MIVLTVIALLLGDAAVQQLTAIPQPSPDAPQAYAVTPGRMDDRLPARALVVSLIGEQETQTLNSGVANVRMARVQVDGWAKTMLDATRLADAAYTVLSPLRRYACADGTSICGVTRDSRNTDYDPEAKMQRVMADYLIWYRE